MKKLSLAALRELSLLALCLSVCGAAHAQSPVSNTPPANVTAPPAAAILDDYEVVSVSATGGNLGGWRGPLYGLSYFNIPEVQEELKLTPDQIKHLTKGSGAGSIISEAMEEVGGRERMAADPTARLLFYRLITAAERSIVADMLNEAQLKRHREICIQWEGINALRRQDVADALHLTSEQRAKIGARGMARESYMRALFANTTPTTTRAARHVSKPPKDSRWEDLRLKCRDLLTPAQLKQWQEMNGPPFKWLAHSRGQDYS